MSEDNGERRHTGIEFQTKWGTLKLRGLGTILTIVLVILALTSYVLYEHMRNTDRFSDRYISAMEVFSQVVEDNSIAQRETSCIISKEGDERRRAFLTGECRVQAETGTSRRRSR